MQAETQAVARRLAELPRKRRWELRWGDCYARPEWTDLLLVIKMDEANNDVSEYFLLPTRLVARTLARDGRLRITRKIFTDEFRHTTRDSVAKRLLISA